ncbi:hypothetical protein EST38_g11195 [Candolleomyces aberdarensis]|uniref:Uncharacterized protein n=1 Tax=Candolleomyces aberdarensis TaxID=2316362 RepID=A0A4Q2D643_9AGAR|nr:hypothetical protein EST38_g11195 [Candolleomyces aberdarensis]
MPKIRPGWTPKQSVYLRIGAIEMLRTCLAGHNNDTYLDLFFEEWLTMYGPPKVQEGFESNVVLASYKERVIATIKWHAYAGDEVLKVSIESHIHTLKTRLQQDLHYLWDLPEYNRKFGTRAILASKTTGLESRVGNMQL